VTVARALLAVPVVGVTVAAGVWVAGGVLTDDFRDRPSSAIGVEPALDASTPEVVSHDAGPPPGSAAPPPGSAGTGDDASWTAPAHRYDFGGAGTTATDSVGGADAYIWNAALDDKGFIGLDGDDQYVSLPNGLLSSSNDKTLEAWLTWRGGPAWQRVFDFGSSDAGELNQGSGVSYLFLTPSSSDGVMSVACSQDGFANETALRGTEALPIDILTHVAVVIDSARGAFSLYLNGTLNATATVRQQLARINDVNLWIGRSQFRGDPSLAADVTEFRIYDRALDADQLARSYQMGPNGPLTSQL